MLTPDHLSALGALSVGGSWRSFSLGVRWSVGHSLGLLICAVLFISLKGELDLHAIGAYCDPFVGMFMIVIGSSGVVGSIRAYRYKQAKKTTKRKKDAGGVLGGRRSQNHDENDDISDEDSEAQMQSAGILTSSQSSSSSSDGASQLLDMRDPKTQRAVSIGMGLLHGMAGPGGILGVVPAIEMQHWQSSFLYLGSFMASSTLSMGIFAAFYGELTRRMGSTGVAVEFGLRVFSSATSVIVGAVWLFLTFQGTSIGAMIEGSMASRSDIDAPIVR